MARLLRRSIGGVVIDHDILRSGFLDSGIPFDLAAKHAYQLQWTLARDIIQQGLNVIIDSTCNFEEVLSQGSALATQYGYAYWYIECQVQDIELLDQRLRARDAMMSQRTGVDCPPVGAHSTGADQQDFRALFRKWIENPCRPEENAIIVDSRGNQETLRDYILNQIVS